MEQSNTNRTTRTNDRKNSHGKMALVVLGMLIFVSFVLVQVEFGASTLAVADNRGDATTMLHSTCQNKTVSFRTQAVPCTGRGAKVDPKLFLSQDGEDQVLMKFFSNLCQGMYLEMGALDGKLFSNSYAFHYGMNWSGVLLEASPNNFKELQKNRPNEKALIHAGVCAKEGDLHWVEGKATATGAFWEFATEHHRNTWFTKESIENATVVKCKRLQQLLDEQFGNTNPLFFDFYSLDIEGAEYGALQTIDFNRVGFGVILVEASQRNIVKGFAVRTFLESKGYRLYPGIAEKTNHASDWFINSEWHSIYAEVMHAS